MSLRTPRSAFTVSRRLSERDRRTPGGETAAGVGGIVDALHDLVEHLTQAASAAGSAEAVETSPGATGPGSARAAGTSRRGGRSGTVALGRDGTSAVFGYTLRMGLDGLTAEPFGDVPAPGADRGLASATPTAAAPAAARAPIVDIFEEPDAVVIIAELPGADPSELTCKIENDTLVIEAAGARSYRKQVDLPVPVRADSMLQRFENGILEIRLARAEPA